MLKRSRETATTLLLAFTIPTASLAEDAVKQMCMVLDSEVVCDCASEALRTQIGSEDYAIYEAIGTDYLARLDAGEGRIDAWTEASRTEATNLGISGVALMGRTNEIGSIHRAAIKDCGG